MPEARDLSRTSVGRVVHITSVNDHFVLVQQTHFIEETHLAVRIKAFVEFGESLVMVVDRTTRKLPHSTLCLGLILCEKHKLAFAVSLRHDWLTLVIRAPACVLAPSA